ncbi:MAG: hypothetical protein VX527_06760 [Planctomycetota bacterium]|nr:hypothetical protein [Planctomycetota bacterium]
MTDRHVQLACWGCVLNTCCGAWSLFRVHLDALLTGHLRANAW